MRDSIRSEKLKSSREAPPQNTVRGIFGSKSSSSSSSTTACLNSGPYPQPSRFEMSDLTPMQPGPSSVQLPCLLAGFLGLRKQYCYRTWVHSLYLLPLLRHPKAIVSPDIGSLPMFVPRFTSLKVTLSPKIGSFPMSTARFPPPSVKPSRNFSSLYFPVALLAPPKARPMSC